MRSTVKFVQILFYFSIYIQKNCTGMDSVVGIHVILGNLIPEDEAKIPYFVELCNLILNGRSYICHESWRYSFLDTESNLLLKQALELASKAELDSQGKYKSYVEIERFSSSSQILCIPNFPVHIPRNFPLAPAHNFSIQGKSFTVQPQHFPVALHTPQSFSTPLPTSDPESVPSILKRPLNPFMFYLKERRAELRAANTIITNREVCNLVGKEWQLLSIKEKMKYKELFLNDKTRYQKELEQLVK